MTAEKFYPGTVHGVLDVAADNISHRGWMQGDLGRRHNEPGRPWDGEFCSGPVSLAGAVNVAMTAYPGGVEYGGEMAELVEDAYLILARRLGWDGDTEVEDLISVLEEWLNDWNNAEGRTAEEVVGELRAAAVEAREGGEPR